MKRECFPPPRGDGEAVLQFLFKQFQNGFVQIFYRKTLSWGGEDGIVTGNRTQDTFRFPQ